MIYQAALTLHIIGIVLFAGATFIDFIISKQFWNVYSAETIISRVQKVAGFGGRFIVLSGIIMISMHRFWAGQIWFWVKMGILIVVLINGAFRQKLGKSLHSVALSSNPGIKASKLRSTLNRVQVVQIILLTGMFVLSVFKFN
jgi:hypothetical protein